MISIENLKVGYSNQKCVLDGLSLFFSEGQIHGIVGLNGAGKTTLLNTLYGLHKHESGVIQWGNTSLNKKHIAYLEAENYFYPNITGREYLRLFPHPEFMLDQWNRLFNLPLDALIETYSSGMKKQLVLLRILKQDKPLMILDEPFRGLDIESAINLRAIFGKLSGKGKTIVITSHIIENLTKICDQLHYLESGIILYSREREQFEAFKEEIIKHVQNKNNALIDELLR